MNSEKMENCNQKELLTEFDHFSLKPEENNTETLITGDIKKIIMENEEYEARILDIFEKSLIYSDFTLGYYNDIGACKIKSRFDSYRAGYDIYYLNPENEVAFFGFEFNDSLRKKENPKIVFRLSSLFLRTDEFDGGFPVYEIDMDEVLKKSSADEQARVISKFLNKIHKKLLTDFFPLGLLALGYNLGLIKPEDIEKSFSD